MTKKWSKWSKTVKMVDFGVFTNFGSLSRSISGKSSVLTGFSDPSKSVNFRQFGMLGQTLYPKEAWRTVHGLCTRWAAACAGPGGVQWYPGMGVWRVGRSVGCHRGTGPGTCPDRVFGPIKGKCRKSAKFGVFLRNVEKVLNLVFFLDF